MRICVIDEKTGLVVNIAEMGGDLPPNVKQPDTPPEGFLWVESETGGIGWKYEKGELVAPEPVPPSAETVLLRKRLMALQALDEEMLTAAAAKENAPAAVKEYAASLGK